MNKRGFDCALSRATSRAVFSPIVYFSISFFLLFFSSILPRLLALFFFFFYLVAHQVSNHLPFAYISLTSLSSTPLHHEIQLRFIPQKLIFILLDSLVCPKISITISLFICLTHAACCMPARKHPSYLWALGEYEVEEMIYFFLVIAITWAVPRDSFSLMI